MKKSLQESAKNKLLSWAKYHCSEEIPGVHSLIFKNYTLAEYLTYRLDCGFSVLVLFT
jgi:hypothetical protein